jgi:hypothetical protein
MDVRSAGIEGKSFSESSDARRIIGRRIAALVVGVVATHVDHWIATETRLHEESEPTKNTIGRRNAQGNGQIGDALGELIEKQWIKNIRQSSVITTAIRNTVLLKEEKEKKRGRERRKQQRVNEKKKKKKKQKRKWETHSSATGRYMKLKLLIKKKTNTTKVTFNRVFKTSRCN